MDESKKGRPYDLLMGTYRFLHNCPFTRYIAMMGLLGLATLLIYQSQRPNPGLAVLAEKLTARRHHENNLRLWRTRVPESEREKVDAEISAALTEIDQFSVRLTTESAHDKARR